MTRYTPLWLQSGSYAAGVDRRLIGALWPGPATAGMAVSSAGAGMALNIAAGSCAIPAVNGTGSVLCTSDAIETVTLEPAPPSGTNRIDLVICQPRGADLDGGTNNDFVFVYVKGAEAASPTPPAAPPGALVLARVRVNGGAATIAAADITDVRPFGLAVAGAAALPPPLAAGAPFQSFTDGSGEVWVAKGGVNGGVFRKARDVLRSRTCRNGAWTVTTTMARTNPGDPAGGYDDFALFNSGSWLATVPLAGYWRVSWNVRSYVTASGQWLQAAIYKSNAVTASNLSWSAGTSPAMQVEVIDTIRCNAGDTLEAWAQASASLTGGTGPSNTYFICEYTGPYQ